MSASAPVNGGGAHAALASAQSQNHGFVVYTTRMASVCCQNMFRLVPELSAARMDNVPYWGVQRVGANACPPAHVRL